MATRVHRVLVLLVTLLVLACTSRASDPSASTDAVCENPNFTCEPSCDDSDCGPLEPFDGNGCLRLPCTTNDECPSGQVCYEPERYGVCDVVNTTECAPGMGGCICTVTAAPVIGYCVDEDDRPTKEAGDCACGCDCGDPGSNSAPMNGSCFCDAGFTWCVPDDPADYTCCPA